MMLDMPREAWEKMIFSVVDENHDRAVVRKQREIEVCCKSRKKAALKIVCMVFGVALLSVVVLTGLKLVSPWLLPLPAAGICFPAAELLKEDQL